MEAAFLSPGGDVPNGVKPLDEDVREAREGLVDKGGGPGVSASGPPWPHEIAPRVWVFKSEGFADQLATLIGLGEEALVVDPPMFQEEAARVEEFARAQGLEIVWLALTHAHGDHAQGMAYFPQALAIAQREFWPTWQRVAPLEAEYFSRVLPGYQGLPLREPEVTFARELRLKRAGRQVIFRSAPGHSPDGLWVELPAERVWIVGDTVLPVPYLAAGDRAQLLATLKELLARWEGGTLVLGHRQVLVGEQAHEMIEANLRYLKLLPQKVAEAAAAGKSKREVLMLPLTEFGLPRGVWEPLGRELHRVNLERTWEEIFPRHREVQRGAGERSGGDR